MTRNRLFVVLALAALLLGLVVLTTGSTTSPPEASVEPASGLRAADDERDRKRSADAARVPAGANQTNDDRTVPARQSQPAARRVD